MPRADLTRIVKQILSSRVYDVAVETALDPAPSLSARLGNRVLLKREDQQPVHSFKIRGAYNRIAQLTEAERRRGVVTASAGNHAQGVALAAKALGIHATIVMGVNTPAIKVQAVKARGAKVVLHGDGYNAAAEHAHKLAEAQGLVYVHPFDEPAVIAGQGTIGMEVLNQHTGPIHAIFVPVGGGGLIAGIAAYVKYLRPEVKVIAVEADGSHCLSAALEKKRRVRLPVEGLDLFADGTSVAQVGKETWAIAREHVDGAVTVTTDELCAAIKDVFDDTRSITEPSGALAVAGMKKYVAEHGLQDETLVAINSGANVNFDRLRHIAERAEVGEQREVVLAVTIDERRGSFRRFCKALGKHNVTEFNYRLGDPDTARIYVGVQVAADGRGEGRDALVGRLRKGGYAVDDLTDNELAKLHVRHLVGGRASGLADEALVRFEFPERPGALLKFLDVLGTHWDITLFHYRNHGSAWGRVLAGFAVGSKERRAFLDDVRALGYRWHDESDNPAVGLFLR